MTQQKENTTKAKKWGTKHKSCSSFCDKDEPCSVTENGECDVEIKEVEK